MRNVHYIDASHSLKKYLDECRWWNDMEGVPPYVYCEERLYIFKLENGSFAFQFGGSPEDAWNLHKEEHK